MKRYLGNRHDLLLLMVLVNCNHLLLNSSGWVHSDSTFPRALSLLWKSQGNRETTHDGIDRILNVPFREKPVAETSHSAC